MSESELSNGGVTVVLVHGAFAAFASVGSESMAGATH